MESLPKNTIFEHHGNTLLDVRKQYELDKPGRMDEAIDILEEWIKKQNHIVKKNIPRDYLERIIINRKGSVERAKLKFDRMCTFRTLLPQFFATNYTKDQFVNIGMQIDGLMPKLTEDNYRIYVLKNPPKITAQMLSDYYRYIMLVWEYISTYDYCTGILCVCDFTEVNIIDFMKIANPVELRHVMSIITEGYGMRLKGIHLLTHSKTIDLLVTLLKQVVSNKIGSRINVYMNMESLYKDVPRKLLPIEFGGEQQSITEIHKQTVDAIFSKEFVTYATKMNELRTDESLRLTDKFNEQYMGTAGSFRALHVD